VASVAGSTHESPLHEAAKTAYPAYDSPRGRFHFLIRRIHSLAGIAFGGYIVVHLAVNATGFNPLSYQLNVDKIHNLEPSLSFIEITTIFTPLLIHTLYGIYVAFAGVKYNTLAYNYGGNLRYTLQRWTSVILFLFILFHVGTLHKWGLHLVYQITHWSALGGYAGSGLFNPDNRAFQTTVAGIRTFWNPENPLHPGNLAVMAFYLLGVWSAVFHFANGLWTSAIAWGLTMTANAQRRWGHVCFGLGALLLVVGTLAWAAFTIAPAARDPGKFDPITVTHPEQHSDKTGLESPLHQPELKPQPATQSQP
jgi:succinate dehydrogenase / fumarate reductase, cytochrome b subunit